MVEDAWHEYREQLTSLNVRPLRAVATLLWDTRCPSSPWRSRDWGAGVLGSGRGDDRGRQHGRRDARDDDRDRAEDREGELPLALALGIVLLAIVLGLNAAAFMVREWSARRYG